MNEAINHQSIYQPTNQPTNQSSKQASNQSNNKQNNLHTIWSIQTRLVEKKSSEIEIDKKKKFPEAHRINGGVRVDLECVDIIP